MDFVLVLTGVFFLTLFLYEIVITKKNSPKTEDKAVFKAPDAAVVQPSKTEETPGKTGDESMESGEWLEICSYEDGDNRSSFVNSVSINNVTEKFRHASSLTGGCARSHYFVDTYDTLGDVYSFLNYGTPSEYGKKFLISIEGIRKDELADGTLSKTVLSALVRRILSDIQNTFPGRYLDYEIMFDTLLARKNCGDYALKFNIADCMYKLEYFERGSVVGEISENSIDDFRLSFLEHEFLQDIIPGSSRGGYNQNAVEKFIRTVEPLFENKQAVIRKKEKLCSLYGLEDFEISENIGASANANLSDSTFC